MVASASGLLPACDRESLCCRLGAVCKRGVVGKPLLTRRGSGFCEVGHKIRRGAGSSSHETTTKRDKRLNQCVYKGTIPGHYACLPKYKIKPCILPRVFT